MPDLAHKAGKIPAELTNADPLRRTLGRLVLFSDNTSSLCGHLMCTPETLAGQRIARPMSRPRDRLEPHLPEKDSLPTAWDHATKHPTASRSHFEHTPMQHAARNIARKDRARCRLPQSRAAARGSCATIAATKKVGRCHQPVGRAPARQRKQSVRALAC
jgi:hypothetical protein